MAEKEVVIKISAKNLTQGEFQKARQALAGLGDETEKTKGKTSGLSGAISSFGKAAPGAFKAVTVAAAAAGTAIVGIATAVIKLGERGAVVSDVQSAFDRLSSSVGTTGATMLGALQAGVKGTLTNFQLMQLANKALGAGLLKSASDAKTLGEGARLLAKRTGGDTAQAFETLTTAIASGRTAQLKQLGLFVDNKKAVEEYAKATGKSVSELTDADRATALQAATLASLRQELENNAPPLADFGEIIEQGKVGVKNLVDELAVMISQSPPLLAAMNGIKDAVSRAFGGEQHSLILDVVNALETGVIWALQFGQTALTAADYVHRGFGGVKVLVLGVAWAFTEVGRVVAETTASLLEQASKIPVIGDHYRDAAAAARENATAIGGISTSLKGQVEDAAAAALGNDSWSQSLNTAKEALGTVSQSMTDAGLSTQSYHQMTTDAATANQNLASAVSFVGTNLASLPPVLTTLDGKLVETKDNVLTFRQLVGDAFVETKGTVVDFGEGAKGVGDLVAYQNQRMTDAYHNLGMKTREESEKTLKKLKEDLDEILNDEKTTLDQRAEALEKFEMKRRELDKQTNDTMHLAQADTLRESFANLSQAFPKVKAFAVAEAVVATYAAAVRAFELAGGWPLGLFAAAASIAAGMKNVATIKSQNFSAQKGTPGLDFMDFGRESPALLHGSEAVIPRGGGHQLAQEIARALAPRSSGDMLSASEFHAGLKNFGDSLSRDIRRGMRDAVLLMG